MKKKLKSILLVDDDPDCNFFHERLLKKMDCVEQIHTASDGLIAIDFLRSTINQEHPSPSIIFLDINMPRMNGWDFLNEYQKLTDKQKAEIVLIMLTTSLNPDDMEKGLSNPDVKGFYNKYLDKEAIKKIINEHFQDHL